MNFHSEVERLLLSLTTGKCVASGGHLTTPTPCSDENWWRGETQLGTGLFPASFVSTNLSMDPEPCECAQRVCERVV